MDPSLQQSSHRGGAKPVLPDISRRSFLKVVSALFAEAATGAAGTANALQSLASQTPGWISTYVRIAPIASQMAAPLLAAHKAIEAVEKASDSFDLALRVAGAVRWAKTLDLQWDLPDTTELSTIRGVFTEADKFLGILSERHSEKLRQLHSNPEYRKLAEAAAEKLVGDSRLHSAESRLHSVLHRLTSSVHSLSEYGPDVADKLPKILNGPRKFSQSLGWRYMEIFSDEGSRETILADPVRDALGDLYTGLRSVFGDSLAGDFDFTRVSRYAQQTIDPAIEQLEILGVEIPETVRLKARIICQTTVVERSSTEQLLDELHQRRSLIPLELLSMLESADSSSWRGRTEKGSVTIECNATMGDLGLKYTLKESQRSAKWRVRLKSLLD